MNIQQYETPTGKTGWKTNTYLGIDSITGNEVYAKIKRKTKKEVKDELKRQEQEFISNGYTKRKKTTVKTGNELIDLWLATYIDTVNKKTYKTACYSIDKYIRPLIGDIRLEKLSVPLMQEKINKLLKMEGRTNYNPITARIKEILKYGTTLEVIVHNPMDKVHISRTKTVQVEEKKIKHYNKEQTKRIIKTLDGISIDDNYREFMHATYLCLLLHTGIRPSEGLAIDWSDINFNKKTISITKTITNSGKDIGAPKTKASIRVVEIDDKIISVLDKWRKVQIAKCIEIGLKRPDMLFYDLVKQTHYRDNAIRDYHEDVFCVKHNISYKGLHCFRHTYATMWVNSGGDWKALQEQLGHSNISMTMNTYAHAEKENKRASQEGMVLYLKNA